MAGRPVVNNGAGGYALPLGSIARLPGEEVSPQLPNMATVKRESVAVDPLAYISSQPEEPILDSTDILENLVASFMSKCRCSPIDTNKIAYNLSGLHELTHACAWKQVVELADNLMFIHEGNAPTRNSAHLLDPVRFRMEGLFALQLFDDLAQEAAKILSEEELAIQSNPSRSNSIDSEVATAMRLLLCEIKVMTGRGDEAVEQLHLLQAWLLKVAELSEDIAMQKRAHCWLARTGCAIVNSFIRQRQWRLAISALREILSRLQQNEKGTGDAHHLRDAIIVIHCLLARTLLQVGALGSSVKFCNAAWDLFSQSRATELDDQGRLSISASKNTSYISTTSTVWNQVQITRGLTMFGQNKHEEAIAIFQTIINHHRVYSPSIQSTMSPIVYVTGDAVFPDQPPIDDAEAIIQHPFLSADLKTSVLAVAVNNLCVCSLFLKKVPLAVATLEALIQENPSKHMLDPVVFNLCTLYDLTCSPEMSANKKRVLQRIAMIFHIHDPMLHSQSFRLN